MVRRILLLLAVLLIVPGLASARDESDVHIESEALGGADGDPGAGNFEPSRPSYPDVELTVIVLTYDHIVCVVVLPSELRVVISSGEPKWSNPR